MCMKAYPQDFNADSKPREPVITCQTADGIQHVKTGFFSHIQHLGINLHSGTTVFMPEVHVSTNFVVPSANPLQQKYL